MILVDKTGHMVSDSSLMELHQQAQKMGLKREWFQNHSKHPHYDLTTQRMRNKALMCGAKLVSSKDLIRTAVN